ncbi:molybdopterin-dependent oxidoreductase [uncultured Desulfuromonas sp.]|uniref:molybdopterin-containing oxidoreductase family protein n=1 Tax=uncultured Desulfuromonas sp. TaxID=181013 RepID=UPI002AABBFB6|nr:molybdopterin-dependent oxidoreductase [uncultured Desulfuromonas sp.]
MNYQQAQRLAESLGEQVIPTVCGMCGPGGPGGGCGIYAFVKQGCFTRVAGMDECPVNRGAVCAKGQAAPQWVYSPDRLTTPLRRVGRKGEGRFEPIGWDDAIDQVAEVLMRQKEEFGPESLAILAPAKRNYNDYLQRFLTVHGSPNYGHSGICAMQRAFAFSYTVGCWPQADYDNSDLIIYWGRQPFYSGPVARPARAFLDARQRGATLVAIKPSMEPDGGLCDQWLAIRPGTDAALALAMLHVVIGDGLIDHAFVEQWCYGFDELKAHVEQFSPAWAQGITGIDSERIVALARLYAMTPRATIDLGNGVEHAPSASDAIRAVAMLMAITGHLDRPGTNLLPKAMAPSPVTLPQRYSPALIDKLVCPEFPKVFQPFYEGPSAAYYGVIESILTEQPYPIRCLMAPGTQPSMSNRGTRNVLAALEKVDFFAVIDVMRTAEMDYADIVIPTATVYESDHPFHHVPGWMMANNPVIQPLGAYKSTIEFFLDLAQRMGYGEDFWQGDCEQAMREQLQPFNLTPHELREAPCGISRQPPGQRYEKYAETFGRASSALGHPPLLPQNKVALYATTFADAGFSPLPQWRDVPEGLTATPELVEEFPLVLSDYHTSKSFSASWQRNVALLREVEPEPMLHIHPETADRFAIGDQDWIRLSSPHGWLKVKAQYYPGIRRDTVMVLHGWWQGCKALGQHDMPLTDGGANVNLLYTVERDKACDPLIWAMSSQTLVKVERWEEAS